MSSNITLNDLLPTIKEVVEAGNEATFVPNGKSMQPMLCGGRDKIILKKPSFPLKKYDLPLYVRECGTVVMHRVVKVKNEADGIKYFMRGDNTFPLESGITEKDIVAVVSSFCRKGKWYSVEDKGYKGYCIFWCGIYPIRRFVNFALHLPGRAIRKICRILRGN